MFKTFDYQCVDCEHQERDQIVEAEQKTLPCPLCRGTMVRVWLMGSKSGNVIGDDIPGGVYIKHGICNDDGTPRRYDSKSEMRRAAEAKGLTNYVEHKPAPGTDKSRHTSRWV